MINEHQLRVERSARYYTLGELTPQTTDLWFVLHGYGQLARHFIRRFDVVQNKHTVVVAPEGLSRLYLDSEYGKVGASWLTREDRDSEIRDYVGYLNQLYETVLASRVGTTPLRLTVLGFSQGAATACRWLGAGSVRADRLILWAGFFPEGLGPVVEPEKLESTEVLYVYGQQDEFLAWLDKPDEYLGRLQAELPSLRVVPFAGTHVIERSVLQTLIT